MKHKTLNEHFKECIPKGTLPEDEANMKRAFFTGAAIVIEVLDDEHKKRTTAKFAADTINHFCKEIMGFDEAIKLKMA